MNNYLYKLLEVIKQIINIFIEFIYPENITCIICNKPIDKKNTYSICKSCFKELHFIKEECIKCGKPIIYHSLEKQDIQGCSYCFDKQFYFDKAISCIEYAKNSKSIVYKLKYNNQTYISKNIAQIMKEKLYIENIKFDYILCVPLHKKRFKKRGFNQAEKIAKYLSQQIGIPYIDALARVSNTKRLYKLNKEQRKIELKNAFIIKLFKNELKNKKVLIVDDIFTTGSTVNEISKLLKLNGVNKVYIITLLTKNSDVYVSE